MKLIEILKGVWDGIMFLGVLFVSYLLVEFTYHYFILGQNPFQ